MSFAKVLNSLVKETGCTSHELAEASGVSSSTISRYRSGKRQPKACSSRVSKIAHGLAMLSDSPDDALAERMERLLNEPLKEATIALRTDNLDALIETLGISMSALAKHLNFDASYLSRVRSGKRNPADVMSLTEGVCRYVVSHYRRSADWENIGDLLGVDWGEIPSEQERVDSLRVWLTTSGVEAIDDLTGDPVQARSLLQSTDDLHDPFAAEGDDVSRQSTEGADEEANSSEWLRVGSLNQDDPPSKDVLEVFRNPDAPVSKVFVGPAGGQEALLVFRKLLEEGKQQGRDMTVHALHAMRGSTEEMVRDLKEWLPLCIAGHMKARCLEEPSYTVRRLLLVSDELALEGSFASNIGEDALFVVTTVPEQVEALWSRYNRVLPRTTPVMEVYDKWNELGAQHLGLVDASVRSSCHRGILCAPPVHTLPYGVLRSAMRRNGATMDQVAYVYRGIQRLSSFVHDSCLASPWIDEMGLLSREEFMREEVHLPLSPLMADLHIPYTYEEYCEHVRATRQWGEANKGFKLRVHRGRVFRNIQILVVGGERAVVMKESLPNIAIMFYHPQMVQAINDMAIFIGGMPQWRN